MRVKAKDVKHCLNCRSGETLVFPDACDSEWTEILIECPWHPNHDVSIEIPKECNRWEKLGY